VFEGDCVGARRHRRSRTRRDVTWAQRVYSGSIQILDSFYIDSL